MLVLDLAFPGSDAADLVRVARSLGALAVAGYLREWPQWSPSMVREIEAQGMPVLPIELYAGQDPGDTLRVLANWGISKRSVVLDVETGSSPSVSWQRTWQQIVDANGWISVGYSQASWNVPYLKRWGALYTWPGIPDQRSIHPIQGIPAGLDAMQYAHAIVAGNYVFDASNFAFPITYSNEVRTMRVIGASGHNETFITDGVSVRYIQTPAELGDLLHICGQTAPDGVAWDTILAMAPNWKPRAPGIGSPVLDPSSLQGPPGPVGPAGPSGSVASHTHITGGPV